jgi:hypothetical protein
MRISNIRSQRPASVKKKEKAKASTGRSFKAHLGQSAGSADQTAATAPSSNVGAVPSILAAQEASAPDADGAKKKLVRRGEDILDRLDEIRHDLLAGTLPRSHIENLAALLRSRRETVTDPVLIEIIDEIELRAEVEIAKLDRGR